VFIVRVWQIEGAVVWFPIFDKSVIECGCHLVNQVTGPRGCGIGLFSSFDQLFCLAVFEFGQDFA
jgi:hypothetical protein